VDDAVLPATTYRNAGLGQEGQSPYVGERTHLAGSGVHAKDLVPNPTASGLIAISLAILCMQSRSRLCFCPLFLLREFCRYFLGKTEKAGRATVFLYWHHHVLSCLAYDVISIFHFF
jgi:hypothetical protein